MIEGGYWRLFYICRELGYLVLLIRLELELSPPAFVLAIVRECRKFRQLILF